MICDLCVVITERRACVTAVVFTYILLVMCLGWRQTTGHNVMRYNIIGKKRVIIGQNMML